MAKATREPDIGRRVVWGILLAAVCLFLLLSLISYDWRDISVLKAPPNSPPGNLFGPVGAWLSFVLFMTLGIGAYLVPVLGLVCGLILDVNREERVWPRVLWCLGLRRISVRRCGGGDIYN